MVALGRRPHSWREDLIRAGDLRPLVFCFFFFCFFFSPHLRKKHLPDGALFAAGVV